MPARRAALPALAALLALTAGCGGPGVESGDCDASACACAEHGPPDYTRATTGAPSTATDPAGGLALVRANRYRTSAGLPPLGAHAQIEQAALAHARFMAGNPRDACWPGVHNELAPGCAGFTGTASGTRVSAAGYSWSLVSEVINWEAEPASAVDAWIWTVYHRQPLLDWRYSDAGFARAFGPLDNGSAFHDVMDFAVPAAGPVNAPPAAPVVFPVPGQTDVPPAFAGYLEAPAPPAPDGAAVWAQGIESGTVVSVHFPSSRWTVESHRVFRAERCEELPVTYVSFETDPNLARPRPSNDVFLYTNAPLQGGTRHVVQFRGTVDGAAWARTWAFTTR